MFAIDIDGTIATANVSEYADYFRKKFQIPLNDIEYITVWWQLFDHPDITGYSHEHPRRYANVVNSLMDDLASVRQLRPLPHACDQVERLTRMGVVKYLVLKYTDMLTPEGAQDWLTTHGFPCPDDIVYCPTVLHKITIILREPGEHVLIDNQWAYLVASLRMLEVDACYNDRLQRALNTILRRLTIVAFGSAAIPERLAFPGLRLIALPSWDQLEEISGMLQREPAGQRV